MHEEVLDIEETIQYLQIDVIKAIMICLVVIDHAFPKSLKTMLLVQFWLRVCVPVFLIVMGFNYANSFKSKQKKTLRDLYSREYIARRFRRFVLPFLVFFIPLSLLSIALKTMNVNLLSGRSILPFWGPGLWYILVILSAVLLLPALHTFYSNNPKVMLVTSFVIEIVTHVTLYLLALSTVLPENIIEVFTFIVQSNVLLYFSSVGVGIWFSSDYELQSPRNRFLWFLLPLSLGYLVSYTITGWRFPFIMSEYNFLLVPYAAIVFLLFMRTVPQSSDNKVAYGLSRIGRSSYHILLLQSLFFSTIYAIVPEVYL